MRARVLLAVSALLLLPSSLNAFDARDLVRKHADYFSPVIQKYYAGDKNLFIKKIAAISKEFQTYRKKVSSETPFMMKIGTLAPEGTEWVVPTREYLEPILSDVSEGLLGITLYTGGILGEDKDILRKMRLGQVHGCGCTAQGVFVAAPELSIFSLPFLFRDYDEVDHVLALFRKDIETILEKKGVILFTLIDTGNFYFFTKERAATLTELRRQKVNTWFGDIEVSFLTGLGINPIPIPVPEVVSSLRTGIINTTISPAAWLLGTQAFAEMRYYIETPVFYSIGAVLLDRNALIAEGKKYGLTERDTDALIRDSISLIKAVKLEEAWKEKIRAYERSAMQGFLEYGIKPVRLTEPDLAAMEQAGRNVWTELADKVYPKTMLDKVTAALTDYRSQKRNPTSKVHTDR